ncbi:MAG TPA: hypothetical protein PLH57_06595 [Oligoflexia bacterium]|nr:hypothetical protein [Oligoflexia bacterium]
MNLLSQYIKDKEYDVRMTERGLSKGTVLREDVEKNQKKLADDSENLATIDVSVLYDQVRQEKSPLT